MAFFMDLPRGMSTSIQPYSKDTNVMSSSPIASQMPDLTAFPCGQGEDGGLYIAHEYFRYAVLMQDFYQIFDHE